MAEGPKGEAHSYNSMLKEWIPFQFLVAGEEFKGIGVVLEKGVLRCSQ